jgi:pyrimidine operon attenuation protein / uracil phosphoribosyltransferase
MNSAKTPILNHSEILTKLERMACEICEKHIDSGELVICGLNSRGFALSKLLGEKITAIDSELRVKNVNAVVEKDSVVFLPDADFTGKHILLMDDVINTGSTLMLVLSEIYRQKPVSIGTVFLAKREHRNFPVKADYVGISIATTLQEHVQFDSTDPDNLSIYLT